MSFVSSLGFALALWFVPNGAHAGAQWLAARRLGVVLNRVSLGFGPTLWSRVLGGTTWRLTPFPVAVFVRLRAPWNEVPPESDLRKASRRTRLAVFGAGPTAILLLAFLAAVWASSYERRVISDKPIVGLLKDDGAARRAGIQVGDVVLTFGGREVHTWTELKDDIANLDTDSVQIEVRRGTEQLRLDVEPERLPGSGQRLVGLGPQQELQPAPGLPGAARLVLESTRRLLQIFGELFTGRQVAETVGGPILLRAPPPPDPSEAGFLRAQVAMLTWLQYFLWCFLAPIDGPRLLALGVEALRRGPLHPRVEVWLNRVGAGFLVLLVALTIKNDLSRLLR